MRDLAFLLPAALGLLGAAGVWEDARRRSDRRRFPPAPPPPAPAPGSMADVLGLARAQAAAQLAELEARAQTLAAERERLAAASMLAMAILRRLESEEAAGDVIDLTPLPALDTPPQAPHQPPAPAQPAPGQEPAAFALASDVTASPTAWLWPGVLPAGALTLLSGQPKMGKSQIAISVAAIVSAGGQWPTGDRCAAGGVLLMETEDSAADTRARLLAAGADLSRIALRGREHGPMDLAGPDMAQLEAQAERMGGVKLLIVSPALAHFGRAGATDDATVRARLQPLITWCGRTGAAAMLITHPPKLGQGRGLDAQFSGADAYRRAARAAFVAAIDASDDEPDVKRKRRLFVCAGSNAGPDDVRLPYRIEGVRLSDGVQTSRVVWASDNAGQTDRRADNGLSGPRTDGQTDRQTDGQGLSPSDRQTDGRTGGQASTAAGQTDGRTVRARTRAWLLEALADGPRDGAELKREYRADGFRSMGVLYDVADELGVIREAADSFGGAMTWRLPPGQTEDQQ